MSIFAAIDIATTAIMIGTKYAGRDKVDDEVVPASSSTENEFCSLVVASKHVNTRLFNITKPIARRMGHRFLFANIFFS